MTRSGLALWLLAALILWFGPPVYLHLYPPKPMQCPPECSDCGHSWASSKPVCTPKNMEGMK